jgi:hypothetical protein
VCHHSQCSIAQLRDLIGARRIQSLQRSAAGSLQRPSIIPLG